MNLLTKNLRDYDYKDNKVIKKTFRVTIKEYRIKTVRDYKINYAMSGGLDLTSLAIISKEILNYDIDTFTIKNDVNFLTEEENNKFNERLLLC